jgi:hypothetical protein
MNILALDLGTHTGYCYETPLGLSSGTWTLAKAGEVTAWGKERIARRRDPRPGRLLEKIQVVNPQPDVVVFEDVQFQTYTYQTQLWSSLRTAVWLAFPESVVFECVPVGTLKKFATGYDKADKVLMARYLRLQHPAIYSPKMDDNEVDAIWIHLWAKRNLSRMKV